MRFARELFVLAVAVLTAMAFGVSSASAVEVSDAVGNHCDPVMLTIHTVDGGCRVEAVSERETQVQAFVSGVGFVTISTCSNHFEAAIGEDGTGWLYNATLTPMEGPPCTRAQCDEANMTKLPWPFNLNSTASMEIDFCLRNITGPEGVGTTCHVVIAVTPNNTTGAHEFSANGTTSGSCENLGGGVRIIGHWNVTPGAGHPLIRIF